MNENEYPVRSSISFEERESRRANLKTGSGKTARNEFLFKTVTVQLILSALVLAALFVMRSVNPSAFDYFKSKYDSLMKRDITFEEIESAVKSVSDFWESGNLNEIEEEITEVEDETEKTEQTEASGGEDILKAKENATFSPVFISEKMISPLDEYTVTSRFGYRTNPISGEYGFHTGLDMAADEGTEIHAVYDGIVIETGFTEIRGNYVIIEHSDSTATGYYHCEKILCQTDENVRKGQCIALVGSTGWSTGPHLHFEVKINSVNCNPEYLLNENKD